MEAPVFLLFCLAMGYLLYWTVINDTRDPNGGYEGWFAIKPPAEKKSDADDRTPPDHTPPGPPPHFRR